MIHYSSNTELNQDENGDVVPSSSDVIGAQAQASNMADARRVVAGVRMPPVAVAPMPEPDAKSDVSVKVLNGVASTSSDAEDGAPRVDDLPDEARAVSPVAYLPANLKKKSHFEHRRNVAADNDAGVVSSVAADALAHTRACLAAFSKKVNRDNSVDYVEPSGRVVLRDTGTKICVAEDKPSDEDILLMLVAAQDKFGDKFKLFGSDEFIGRCQRIAVAHEIKMQDEDGNKKNIANAPR